MPQANVKCEMQCKLANKLASAAAVVFTQHSQAALVVVVVVVVGIPYIFITNKHSLACYLLI
jgi:hypothetical protein